LTPFHQYRKLSPGHLALHEALCGHVPLDVAFWGKSSTSGQFAGEMQVNSLGGSFGFSGSGVGGSGGGFHPPITKILGEVWDRQRVCADLEMVLNRLVARAS